MISRFALVTVVAGASALDACSSAEHLTESTGQAQLSLNRVPEDVGCIRVTVEGTRVVTRSFDVNVGHAATLSMSALPLGDDTFIADAYSGGCRSLGSDATPTWVSDPTVATVTLRGVAHVKLVMHRAARGLISVDFHDEDAGVPGAPLDAGIVRCVNSPAGLVGWWPGDGSAKDIANENNGTPVGNSSFALGLVGQAFSLSDSNSYIRVPNNPSLDTPDGLTIDAWIYPMAVDGPRVIASKWDDQAGQWSWVFKLSNGTLSMQTQLSPSGEPRVFGNIGGTASLPLNTWSHVAATYDRSTSNLRTYVNGSVDNEGAAEALNSAINSSPTDIWIGAVNGSDGYEGFQGLIDELDIFSRALTSNEIKSVFDAGSAGKCESVDSLRAARASD